MMSHTSLPDGDGSANKQLIDALLRSRLFRDYESVFTRATGLPLTLQPLDYWQLAHHGKKQENPFCALLAERPATLAVCLQAHESMIRHTEMLPHSMTCPFGLTETAVPVKLGEKTIGYLRIGQVLRHTPVESDTEKVARVLSQHGVPFTKEIHAAWDENLIQKTVWAWGAYVDRLENGWLATSPDAKAEDPATNHTAIDDSTFVKWAEETHKAAPTVWYLRPADDVHAAHVTA